MNTHCTSIAREAGWQQEQNAVNFADAARAEAERLAGIAAHFSICRDDSRMLFAPDGQAVQLAMALTGMDGKTRLVIVRAVDGLWTWEAENMGNCPFAAWELIAVVKQRIGARLTAQLTGRAN